MLKPRLIAFAILFAGASATSAFAQQPKDLSSDKSQLLTYDMLVNQYHFPVKKHTGNPDKDQQVYAAEKQKWVAANQELYRRYNSQGIKSNPESRKRTQPVLIPSK